MPDRTDITYDQLLRDPNENFAPPVNLPRLDPVIVRPPARPRTTLPTPNLQTKPSIGARLASGIARGASRMLAILTPMNSGPEGTGNLFGGPGALYPPGTTPPAITLPDPEQLLELDTVYITPPPRGPTRVTVAPDEISPPDWWEIATREKGETFRDWNRIIDAAARIGRRAYDTIDFLRGLDDRRAPQPLSSAGSLQFPAGPLVFPELEPGYLSSPATRPASPIVLPGPLEVPNPYRIGSPGFDPLPATRTRPATRPGTNPATRTPADPLSPFFQLPANFRVPDNYRPARPGPTRPEFLTDTTPGMFDELSPLPGMDPDADKAKPDQCQCEKPPKKKKPKSKPRDVCYQGTYTQREKGIMYAPKRTVPCEKGAIEAQRKSKKPTTRRPELPGLLPFDWS